MGESVGLGCDTRLFPTLVQFCVREKSYKRGSHGLTLPCGSHVFIHVYIFMVNDSFQLDLFLSGVPTVEREAGGKGGGRGE